MNQADLMVVLIRLAGAFLVAFPAIGVWSSVRDVPWTLIGAGAVLFFVDALWRVLILLGVFSDTTLWYPGGIAISYVLAGLPLVLWAVGFLVLVIRRRY